MIRPFSYLAAVMVLSLGGPISLASCWTDTSDTFSVADSISMVRLVDPPSSSSAASRRFKFSPDGKYFVTVTRTGDLETDTNAYRLHLHDTAEVLEFVNGTTVKLPEPRLLVSFTSTSTGTGPRSRGGISDVRWLPDSQTVAFLGVRRSEKSQVFTFDIISNELRQLTSHPTPVSTYDISSNAEKVIYSAGAELPDWSHRNRHGYAVRWERPRDLILLAPDRNAFTANAIYIAYPSRNATKELQSDEYELTQGVWLSPNGRWAIGQALATDVPSSWLRQYESWQGIGMGRDAERYEGSAVFSEMSTQVTRYVLIDTVTGEIEPVIGAPAAAGVNAVHWRSDSQSAVVVNTHLPLKDVDALEIERRRSAAVIELQLPSRRIRPIAYFPSRSGHGGIVDTVLINDELLQVHYRSNDGKPSSRMYKRADEEWGEIPEPATKRTKLYRLSLRIMQNMNTPPEILATDSVTGKQRVISDLNPQLDDSSLARMETFTWTDENDRTWKGGLLFPPGYRKGQKLPLVIQTYGFSPHEFLVDGPRGITSAFAARPLAGRGMLVLQMPNQPSTGRFDYLSPQEGHNYVAAYEAAVRDLDSGGFIDPTKVGIIGWSRTGMHVSYAVAFSEISFSAATIADSTSAGFLSYINSYGRPYPGMVWTEWMIGAPFWGDNRQLWLERSPTFNAHKIGTPLRIEVYGSELTPYWGMFAVMRLHEKPVEMIHIPQASHLLQRPQARYTSQEGNVDWFSFWLQGCEDKDPAKREQYRRWRELRKLYQNSVHSAGLAAQ